MSAPENTIVLRNLTHHYGHVRAVDNVSFSVARGEVVGFLGPNGAGKSTTLRILCGLLPATSGEAYLCGVSVARDPLRARRHMGYMPENNPLPEDLRVMEYLHLRARLKDIPSRERKASVEAALEACDLQHKARTKVIGTLSKGFRQRVGIADAILAHPDVVIMDEPTIGLDPHQVIGIRDLIGRLRGRMSVIFSSHILSEIERSCDRVVIINQGHLVASGTATQLRQEFLPGCRWRVVFRGDAENLCAAAREVVPDLRQEALGEPDTEGSREILLASASADTQSGEALLLRLSRLAGITLREYVRMEANLENIFLAATRKSWKETLPESTPQARQTPSPRSP